MSDRSFVQVGGVVVDGRESFVFQNFDELRPEVLRQLLFFFRGKRDFPVVVDCRILFQEVGNHSSHLGVYKEFFHIEKGLMVVLRTDGRIFDAFRQGHHAVDESKLLRFVRVKHGTGEYARRICLYVRPALMSCWNCPTV